MLEESDVRVLAEWRGDPFVTSFYLDVDGRRFPRPSDYAPNITALLKAARDSARRLGKPAAEAVEENLARISGWLNNGLDRHAVRGVAAFAAPGLFQTLDLPVPVRDQVVIGSCPDIAQLCQVLAGSRPVLVVAVDRQRSRVLRLDLEGVHELAAPADPVERQADTDVELGSFEHRQMELRRQHLRRVAGVVSSELEQHPAEQVVLSGTAESVADLEAHLPKQVASRVVGRIALPPNAADRELAALAQRLIEAQRVEHQRAITKELEERASEGKAAVTGLSPTLEALGADRAQVLVVEEGWEVPGGRCRECSQLVGEEPTCPRCGGAVIAVVDVVAAAISEAFLHHVRLEFCEEGSLANVGHIGAFERP
jgi:peptide chain release factor subunit 1